MPRISRTRSFSATASETSRSFINRCKSTVSALAPCMATWTSRRGQPHWINSARVNFPCWSPPTSPPAASTFPKSATFSISTFPTTPDDYVHRIGRTGRAGRLGTAISIVSPSDQKSVAAIEKLIGQPITRADVAPVPDNGASPQPVREEHAERPPPGSQAAPRFAALARRPQQAPEARSRGKARRSPGSFDRTRDAACPRTARRARGSLASSGIPAATGSRSRLIASCLTRPCLRVIHSRPLT